MSHITINNTTPRIRYVSNGILATYTYPFAIFENSDLKVYFGSTLQASSTYTITGAGSSSGGTVTLSTVPSNGTIITLVRELSIERTSDFQEGSSLRADTLNHELDYQIACQQQIADNLNRSMVLPPYAVDNNINLTLPTPNAGKAIVWNAAGTNLENSTISVNALATTIENYKTSAETSATTATTQAGIATTKANEATTAANRLNTFQANCITEIPQNILADFNNNTLTISAGSKVYVPNGANSFDLITINNDLTQSVLSSDYMFFLNSSNLLAGSSIDKCFSGNEPTNPSTGTFWYDTTNNLVKRYNGTSWDSGFSLPIFVLGTTLKHVFNGFGYIGKTVFALPNIKALIANGRNTDGTVKNTQMQTASVFTKTITNNGSYSLVLINDSFAEYLPLQISEKQPTSNYTLWYRPSENKLRTTRTGSALAVSGSIAVDITISNGAISEFQPKFPNHSADYNDLVRKADVNLGNLNNEAITNLNNSGIRTIANTYISYTNGTNWYRVWSDGWIEQGGISVCNATNTTTNFPKAFTNTNYTILTTPQGPSIAYVGSIGEKATTYFGAYSSSGTITFSWYACGY